jgi:hypothetical protein
MRLTTWYDARRVAPGPIDLRRRPWANRTRSQEGRACCRLMLERAIRFLTNSQHFCLNFY